MLQKVELMLTIILYTTLQPTMFKITTRPPTSALFPGQDSAPSTHRKHPAEMAGMMDIDNDVGEGSSTLAGVVTPGEIIVSAKEFMR
jgi:hypothetical protein